MAYTRIKDMPRAQQKAVFAKMADNGYMRRLESAEKYHRRRDFLVKKHDLAEETEDRIAAVYTDKKLTYRQKMGKIGKIKAEAARKLVAHEKAETAPTVVGEIRKEKFKQFRKKAYLTSITEVPEGHDRSAFDATIETRKMRSDALFSHEGLLLTQAEYVEGLKNRGRKLPKGSIATAVPPGMRKRIFDSHVFHAKPRKNSYIKVDGLLIKQSTYKKALRRNARVRYPSLYGEEKKKKNMTYRQLKKGGSKIKSHTDTDKDGMSNAKDCRPLDKTQQHPKGSYLAFAEKKNEQLRLGEISTGQYKKDMAAFRKKQRGGLPVGIISRSKTRIAHSKELDKKIREMSKLGLSRERICRKYGIEPARVDDALGHPKNLTYRQLKKKGYELDPKHDSDKDGVPNAKDCRPLDKKKQHGGRVGLKKGTMLEKAVSGYMYARSPKGREKIARARIREIETKKRAEVLEIRARKMEQQYQQEHPSAFTRLRKNIAERRKKKSIYA